jgi:hypothetical protein
MTMEEEVCDETKVVAIDSTRHENSEDSTEVSWDDVRGRLKLGDARARLLLELFENQYNITSASDAFTQIPVFLGDYMVREFDYKDFCIRVGSLSEKEVDDDTSWVAHLSKHLSADLVAAAALMMRLAVVVAKAHQLETPDWQDINDACGNAVRSLPNCYRLQRALPGAISHARAWRFLAEGPKEVGAQTADNPWNSEEGKKVFEETYNFSWSQIEALCQTDQEVLGAFSGHLEIVELAEVGDMNLVTLKVLRVGPSPGGFPPKSIEEDDVVIWEVEAALGRLLEPGFSVEADFCMVHNSACFMTSLVSIAPSWVP